MKKLLVSNRKGGVGKTTITCHAAWHFAEKRRVLVVELDTQRNGSATLEPHKIDVTTSQLLTGKVEIPGLSGPGIAVIEADDELKSIEIGPQQIATLKSNLDAVADKFEVCIFDAAPSADTLNVGPMIFASHVLAPIELTEYSLQGIESLLQSIIGMQKKFNPNLVFLGMLPNKFVANSPRQKEALTELFAKVGNKFMFDAVLHMRQAYEQAASTKEPAWKDTKTASRVAGKEIRTVMEKLEKRVFA